MSYGYLQITVNMPLTLEADNTFVMKLWVDTSLAAHADMRRHTGGILSLGKGVIYGTFCQKLKCSTEGELIAVNDVMPQVMWTRYFLAAQGYQAKEAIVYQNNQSTLLLAKNGKHPAARELGTLIFVTSLLQIAMCRVKCRFNIAQRKG